MAGKHYGIDVMAAGKTRWLALQSFFLGLAFFSTFHPSPALVSCVCGEWMEGGGGRTGRGAPWTQGNQLEERLVTRDVHTTRVYENNSFTTK